MEKKKWTPFSIISMIILIALTIFFMFPFYWILTGAFKLQSVAVQVPPEWFPMNPTLENFEKTARATDGKMVLQLDFYFDDDDNFGVYFGFACRIRIGEEKIHRIQTRVHHLCWRNGIAKTSYPYPASEIYHGAWHDGYLPCADSSSGWMAVWGILDETVYHFGTKRAS